MKMEFVRVVTIQWTPVSNHLINDKRLGTDARFLMVWLLSKPDGWRLHYSHVMSECQWGKDKLYRIINSLLAVGYLTRTTSRDGKGRIVATNYVVKDVVVPAAQGADPFPGFPDTGGPETGGPETENKERYKSLKGTNTNILPNTNPVVSVARGDGIDEPKSMGGIWFHQESEMYRTVRAYKQATEKPSWGPTDNRGGWSLRADTIEEALKWKGKRGYR
jgi:hypothetical protein